MPFSWPEHRNGAAARRSCYDQETGPRDCRSAQQTPKKYPRECYDGVIQAPEFNADRFAIQAIQRTAGQATVIGGPACMACRFKAAPNIAADSRGLAEERKNTAVWSGCALGVGYEVTEAGPSQRTLRVNCAS